MTKNLRDLQGPALAIVLERLKPNGAFHGTVYCSFLNLYKSLFVWQSCFMVINFLPAEPSMGPAAKNGSKVAKSNANGYGDRTQKHGSKAVSSVWFPCVSFFFLFSRVIKILT